MDTRQMSSPRPPGTRLMALALSLVCLLLLVGCLGPRPELQSKTVTAPPPNSDEPYRVEAVVSNHSIGEGQVTVEASLINKKTGVILVQQDTHVQLGPNETAHVLLELQLPPSVQDVDPQDIDTDVQAHYPD